MVVEVKMLIKKFVKLKKLMSNRKKNLKIIQKNMKIPIFKLKFENKFINLFQKNSKKHIII